MNIHQIFLLCSPATVFLEKSFCFAPFRLSHVHSRSLQAPLGPKRPQQCSSDSPASSSHPVSKISERHLTAFETPITHLEDESIVRCFKKAPKLLLIALVRIEQSQHDEVHAAHQPFIPRILRTGFSQAVIVDDNACAWFEGRDKILQKLHSVRVGVVVKDPSEVVDFVS